MHVSRYQITAHNYAHDSENRIHSDDVAARYGFRGGLVPGVADYAYLARAVYAAWGEPWLRGGSMQAKFVRPVYHGDVAVAEARETGVDGHLDLVLLDPGGETCAIGSAVLRAGQEAPVIEDYPWHPPLDAPARAAPSVDGFPAGRIVGGHEYPYDPAEAEAQAVDKFVEAQPRTGGGVRWHPALCLHDANMVVRGNVDLGPWVHTASHVHYFDEPAAGEMLSLRGRVADTYVKRGNVVTELDLAMFADARRPIARIRHTAIIRLG